MLRIGQFVVASTQHECPSLLRCQGRRSKPEPLETFPRGEVFGSPAAKFFSWDVARAHTVGAKCFHQALALGGRHRVEASTHRRKSRDEQGFFEVLDTGAEVVEENVVVRKQIRAGGNKAGEPAP